MHMPCMSKLARKSYMQPCTCKKNSLQLLVPLSSCDFLLFLFLAPRIKVCHTHQECCNKNLSLQEYERERENNESSKTKLTKGYQMILRSLFMNEASILFIFHYFPPHMQLVTFHLLFLLISIILINKYAKNSIFSFPKPQPLPLKIS